MQADPSTLSRRDVASLASLALPWTPHGEPHFAALATAWRSYAELSGPFNREQAIGQMGALLDAAGCIAAIYASAEHFQAAEWRQACGYIKPIRASDGLTERLAGLLASDQLVWSGSINQAFLDVCVTWVVVDELLAKSRWIKAAFDGVKA